MEPKKQLFIVEDHRLFREGLKAILSSGPEYEIIGEAEDGLEAIRRIKKTETRLGITGSLHAADERVIGPAGNQGGDARGQDPGAEHP
jgi:DNA-binding NarL/FixJ family response regulator